MEHPDYDPTEGPAHAGDVAPTGGLGLRWRWRLFWYAMALIVGGDRNAG